MSRVAAMHQPNFFPWLGYFDKVARADVFVVLDDVQYQKTGSSWSNRVKLLISGKPRWVTAPVRRPAHGTACVNELDWAGEPWRQKLLRTLQFNYSSAPFFGEAMSLLKPLICNPEDSLAAYNLRAIKEVGAALDLRMDKLVLSSAFQLRSTANERLIELVKAVGCDTYMAGGGASGYQEDVLFAQAGVSVEYQSFVPPVYEQHGSKEFSAGLSVIDALMNCGIAGTRKLLAL